MTNLPALPEGLDPDARHVELYRVQCRECGESGPVANKQDRNDPGHRWDGDHHAATGHSKIYMWTMTRSAGETFTLRPKARRKLGTREN